ncbi:MAG TPA: DUF1080 domain-containing protein [Isosphaeraceae bacterium]|jgi:hypothetical protein|nr:DUF1080 domain-containing protein [Isosphaeraceae bacterium]
MRPILARLALVAAAALCLGMQAGEDEGFKHLVQGDDPAQFQLVGIDAKTISIKDGDEVHVSGKPNGYFATKKSYKNYVLKFEWKYERPDGLAADAKFKGNSGLLLHIQGEAKVWPRCIEFQLANSEVGKIYPIDGARFSGKWDRDAYTKAIRPVGEWNKEQVTSKDGALTCTLNGTVVTGGTGANPDHGAIGWQSEGAPIVFRNIKIKPLD